MKVTKYFKYLPPLLLHKYKKYLSLRHGRAAHERTAPAPKDRNNITNDIIKTMTEKINFKNMLMLAMMLLASVSFTSCLGNDNGDEEEAETPLSTGLCGISWYLQSIEGVSDESLLDPNDCYIFDLTGNGSHRYTDKESGEVKIMTFTWKSYTYTGTTHRLALKYAEYGDMEFSTIYTIDAEGRLCMVIGDSEGNNRVAYYEAR